MIPTHMFDLVQVFFCAQDALCLHTVSNLLTRARLVGRSISLEESKEFLTLHITQYRLSLMVSSFRHVVAAN